MNTSQIILSQTAYEHNLKFIKSLLPKDTIYSSVVKGNAYGHGIPQFVKIAEACGVDHFSVYSADEAHEVYKATQSKPTLMIMGYVEDDEMEWAIGNGIQFFVFDLQRLMKSLEVAKKLKMKAHIHLELETGMNRTGISDVNWEKAIDIVKSNPRHLELVGLCTHFAGAEAMTNYLRIDNQKENFDKAVAFFEDSGLHPQIKHACCSAAMIRFPEMIHDMVRIGILQYGFWPSLELSVEYVRKNKATMGANPLRRIISWKSQVMNVKYIKKGDYIGYGTTYLAQRPTVIANVPVGYAHGFSRSLSNQGRVLIKGYRLPVIGMVNMNSMMVDITDIDGVEKGDEVVLIGEQEELSISVASFGELSDQLNYELLTRLPHSIPRLITE